MPLGLADLAAFARVTVYAEKSGRGEWEGSTTCGQHARLQHPRAESPPVCPIFTLRCVGRKAGYWKGSRSFSSPEALNPWEG